MNAAGVCKDSLLLRSSETHTLETINTNLLAPIMLSKLVIRDMLKSKGGCILNIASVVGSQRAGVGQTIYASSKAGLVGFTRSLALEMAPKGLRVNAILPGYIQTAMTSNINIPTIPLGTMGHPNHIADAALFLAKAEYITGHCLVVDGGVSLYNVRFFLDSKNSDSKDACTARFMGLSVSESFVSKRLFSGEGFLDEGWEVERKTLCSMSKETGESWNSRDWA